MFIFAFVVFELLIFGVLIYIFRKVMTQNVTLATQHLEELNYNYSEKEKEADRRLEEARQKSQELLTTSRQEAEKQRLEIIARAEEEREQIVAEARSSATDIIQQADKTRQQLLAEMEGRVAKEAVSKACELVQETLPEQFRQMVHTQWLEELISGEFGRLDRLHIPEGMREVRIVSAFALQPQQRKAIVKKITESLGREVEVKEEVDPKIVAGLLVAIGDLVLDGSLKNKIQEKART